MTKILHLDSSVNGEESVTRDLTRSILGHLQVQHPEAAIDYRDLVADPLDHLLGRPDKTAELVAFQDADIVVIGAPTYNFTVPTQLKAWFDRIAVAGETFRYTADGPEGMAGPKRVIVAIASGGDYDDGHAFEHNKSYVKAFFQFLGLEPEFVAARGVAAGKEEAMERAEAQIEETV